MEEKQPRKKPGPKPKQLPEMTVLGLPVGRDKKIVPPDEVYKLAAIGCKDTEICNWFGIGPDALRNNFAAELTKGREDVKIALRRAQLTTALEGNATMQIWLGKNLLGQSDNPTDTAENQALPWTEKDI
jgi:hypothetical protein